jgi:Flp pilus assembly protein TadD
MAESLSVKRGLGAIGDRVDDRRFRIGGCVAVALVALALHANTFGHPFVNWDDPSLIEENEAIRSLAPGHVLKLFVPVSGDTYQPVRVLSYALDYALWELKPQGYHVVNVLLHAGAGIWLFLLAWLLLGRMRPKQGRDNRVVALIIALIWVAHPINVEAVAWAASRKYGLLAFFGFAAFCCHLRSSQGDRVHWGYASGAAVLAMLAVMSSPFGIVFPPLFLLADYCSDRELRKHWRCYLPTAAIFAIFAGVLWLALMGDKGISANYADKVAPQHLLLTMLRVLFDYGRNLLLPLFLNAKYANTVAVGLNLKIIVAILAIIGGIAATIWRLRAGDKRPLLCLGWAAIAWAPVSNIVTISTTMADRYLYIASVGIFLGFGLLLDGAARRFSAKPVLAGTVILLLLAGLLTVQRNAIWGDNLQLWADSVAKDPASPMAQFNYANALQDAERYDEALQHYLVSRKLFPTHVSLHNNLGTLYARMLRYDAAIASFEEALRLSPNNISALQQLGSAYGDAKRPREAAAAFAKWGELTKAPAAYREAGLALGHGGLHAEAIAQFQKLLELDPNSDVAHKNMGVSYANLGQMAKAAEHFEAAIRLNPQDAGSKQFLQRVRAALQKSP